jgi:hypothetical protein
LIFIFLELRTLSKYPLPVSLLKSILDVQPTPMIETCRLLNVATSNLYMSLAGKKALIGVGLFGRLMKFCGLMSPQPGTMNGEAKLIPGVHLWMVSTQLQADGLRELASVFHLKEHRPNIVIPTALEQSRKWACFQFELPAGFEGKETAWVLLVIRKKLETDLSAVLPQVRTLPLQINENIDRLISRVSSQCSETEPPAPTFAKLLPDAAISGFPPATDIADDALKVMSDDLWRCLKVSTSLRPGVFDHLQQSPKDRDQTDDVANVLDVWRSRLLTDLHTGKDKRFSDHLIYALHDVCKEEPLGAIRLDEALFFNQASKEAARQGTLTVYRSEAALYYVGSLPPLPDIGFGLFYAEFADGTWENTAGDEENPDLYFNKREVSEGLVIELRETHSTNGERVFECKVSDGKTSGAPSLGKYVLSDDSPNATLWDNTKSQCIELKGRVLEALHSWSLAEPVEGT